MLRVSCSIMAFYKSNILLKAMHLSILQGEVYKISDFLIYHQSGDSKGNLL